LLSENSGKVGRKPLGDLPVTIKKKLSGGAPSKKNSQRKSKRGRWTRFGNEMKNCGIMPRQYFRLNMAHPQEEEHQGKRKKASLADGMGSEGIRCPIKLITTKRKKADPFPRTGSGKRTPGTWLGGTKKLAETRNRKGGSLFTQMKKANGPPMPGNFFIQS